MAVVNVTFGTASGIGENGISMPVFRPRTGGATEEETIGASSVATTLTSTEKSGRGMIRVVAEAACYIEIGASPTAVAATSMRMEAGATDYFSCDSGDKVAVIEP